jgi:hypothetical protein
MLTKDYEKKLDELRYALRCKGILKTNDEIFDMMIGLVKREIVGD